MRIRIKKSKTFGESRIDSISKIDNVELKADMTKPENNVVEIYFKGVDSSGILTLKIGEAKKLADGLIPLTNVIKDSENLGDVNLIKEKSNKKTSIKRPSKKKSPKKK